jgi:transcription termination factor Rho
MDIAKIKRFPISKLRFLATKYGVPEAQELDRAGLLAALAQVNTVASASDLPSAGQNLSLETSASKEAKEALPVLDEVDVLEQALTPPIPQPPAEDNGHPQDRELSAEENLSAKRKRKRIRRFSQEDDGSGERILSAAPSELPTEKVLYSQSAALSAEPPTEPAAESAVRISVHELIESLRVSMQGVFTPVERQSHGYLRSALYHYHASPDDVYVPGHLVRQYNLRWGDTVEGKVRLPKEGERAYTLVEITQVNGLPPEYLRERRSLEHLTALFPTERFRLSEGTDDLTLRVIDLFSPIGKGQRGLIVAQPKTGKTIILQKVANAILRNHPEVYMLVLLVDERPEEVTEFSRNVAAEVVASTFDEEAARQVELAETVIEKAKRLAETGLDVVVLMDSITRLARAYNHATPVSGRILTGGMDSAALHKPKRFFGAARKIEEGGSLTIVATALVDTGSKMDEVVFEEYKGTGNMELKLDRRLADRRIFPAINVLESGTRHEEALMELEVLARVWALRKFLAELKPDEATEFLLDRMRHTRTNEEFLEVMSKWSR